jgi:hypothetical protein
MVGAGAGNLVAARRAPHNKPANNVSLKLWEYIYEITEEKRVSLFRVISGAFARSECSGLMLERFALGGRNLGRIHHCNIRTLWIRVF